MNKREQIWLGVFLVIPIITARVFADTYAPDSKASLLYDVLFGFVASLVGFAIYYFTKAASTKIRAFFAGGIVLVFILSVIGSTRVSSYLHTCKVCGYKAIETDDPICGYCYEEISEERMKEKGLNSISELVYSRQLFVFYDDSIEQVDFYKPTVTEEGYEKDKSWKPVITKEDLLDIREELKKGN